MSSQPKSHQNVVVMRHGDRADIAEPMWVTTAARPWDPPLIEDGLIRAFCTGRKFRTKLGFPIHRVIVSPFLRCIQTASEVVTALCAVNDDPNAMSSKDVGQIDPSRVKVSVEFGLGEMSNHLAICTDVAPKDGDFGFKVEELESLLPAGTVDRSMKRVYEEITRYGEEPSSAMSRYLHTFKALADKYPSENLLLVTHGEAVGVAVSTYLSDKSDASHVIVHELEFCGYAELRRPIFTKDGSVAGGEFTISSNPTQTGVRYFLENGTEATNA